MTQFHDMWTRMLTREEIDAKHKLTATIDPLFASQDRKWWESRTADQLRVEMAIAWDCATPDAYQMARSYLALGMQ